MTLGKIFFVKGCIIGTASAIKFIKKFGTKKENKFLDGPYDIARALESIVQRTIDPNLKAHPFSHNFDDAIERGVLEDILEPENVHAVKKAIVEESVACEELSLDPEEFDGMIVIGYTADPFEEDREKAEKLWGCGAFMMPKLINQIAKLENKQLEEMLGQRMLIWSLGDDCVCCS